MSIVAALTDSPAAARRALAHRLAALIDDETTPPYVLVQGARALAPLLATMIEADDVDEQHRLAGRILRGVA